MRYLITGGAGFIGSHLAEKLLDQGHQVTIIDNLSTGSFQNIIHLEKHDNFRLVADDIEKSNCLEDLVKSSDSIYHLAAAVGVKLIIEEPVKTIQKNINGTERILSLANKWRKQIIFTSTSEVYGKNPKASFAEEDDMVFGNTHNFRWSYAASKAIDEFLILSYHQKYALPAVIFRLFNTVGPRQTSKYGMVIPNFVKQALRNEDITIYGDGQQTRTFCHIKDAVAALVDTPHYASSNGQVFNIGGDHEISIEALAAKVKTLLGSSSEIKKIPYAIAYAKGFEDMRKRVPNIGKIKALTGYEPKNTIDQIILDVADYFQQVSSFFK